MGKTPFLKQFLFFFNESILLLSIEGFTEVFSCELKCEATKPNIELMTKLITFDRNLCGGIDKLSTLLSEIAPFAKNRINKIKESLSEKLTELDSKNIDENRFEQELIYYLEKQDITEEQVRLSTHLNYFIDTMKTDSPNGKKLGFISQEIGREINTIGSKSSDAEMQKIVVEMKDELEKIKEQLLNIL